MSNGTPGQTVGPFFRYGLEITGGGELVAPHSAGAIRLSGTVYDGAGDPIPDALVEIWQNDAAGAIPTAEGSFGERDGFTGFGRVHVTEGGQYEFWTVLPDADFIPVVIFARGLMDRLHSRIYLPGRSDAFLESLEPDERASLVAVTTDDGLRHDIRLQGDRETVFLAYPELFDAGLLSPATAGSDGIVSDQAVLDALWVAEVCYLRALVAVGIAPASAELPDGHEPFDLGEIVRRSRDGGNPVIPLIAELKKANPDAAAWVHRGATSQDILDTALMLTAQRARGLILSQLEQSIGSLAALAHEHRGTVAAARTLTQHAVPTTYGLRFATWLTTLLDARDALAAVTLPVQLGGAGGTLASLVELGGLEKAIAMPAAFAQEIGLEQSRPWHVSRAPVTRLGDALVGLTDAFGTIGANVATLSRTEIAELSEPSPGGSSTMPQKQNPVLSVLLRSVSLRAPGLASTLHVAAASFVDERPDGAWHAEWPTLRELLRLAVGGAARLGELLDGLRVNLDAVARNESLDDLRAEQRSFGGDGGDYIGLSDHLIDLAIERGTRMIPRIALQHLGGEGDLLVLGPSLGTSTILWESTAALLTKHYRVAAWDLPGHGHSPAATEPFTVGEIALGLLDAIPEDTFRYAGVSLGGATGLEVLLHAPERVKAAAILNSGAKIGTTEGWVERAIVTRAQGTASLVVPSASRWFAHDSIARHPDLTGRLLHSLRDADDESYALCAEALALYDMRALLGNITVPVLALWGEHDGVVGEREASEIASGVQHGSVSRVAGAAHLAPAEEPEAVASVLREFFEGAA